MHTNVVETSDVAEETNIFGRAVTIQDDRVQCYCDYEVLGTAEKVPDH